MEDKFSALHPKIKEAMVKQLMYTDGKTQQQAEERLKKNINAVHFATALELPSKSPLTAMYLKYINDQEGITAEDVNEEYELTTHNSAECDDIYEYHWTENKINCDTLIKIEGVNYVKVAENEKYAFYMTGATLDALAHKKKSMVLVIEK